MIPSKWLIYRTGSRLNSARALSRLSVLAYDLGDLIDALDVNPLIVSEKGCVAVDALVEPSTISHQRADR